MAKADTENTSAKPISARLVCSSLEGKQSAASPTSQSTYQGKNHVVTINKAPKQTSVACTNVRRHGARQIQIAPSSMVAASVTMLMNVHVRCWVKKMSS